MTSAPPLQLAELHWRRPRAGAKQLTHRSLKLSGSESRIRSRVQFGDSYTSASKVCITRSSVDTKSPVAGLLFAEVASANISFELKHLVALLGRYRWQVFVVRAPLPSELGAALNRSQTPGVLANSQLQRLRDKVFRDEVELRRTMMNTLRLQLGLNALLKITAAPSGTHHRLVGVGEHGAVIQCTLRVQDCDYCACPPKTCDEASHRRRWRCQVASFLARSEGDRRRSIELLA